MTVQVDRRLPNNLMAASRASMGGPGHSGDWPVISGKLAKSCQKDENIPPLLCLSPTDIVAGGTPSNALAK